MIRFPDMYWVGQIYWQAPQLWPGVAAGSVLVFLLVLWLYPAQSRLTPWPWRWALPALRGAALTALLVSLLKPVAIRLANLSERGSVAIIIDRSASMSVVDNARTDAERVALADALGRLKPGIRAGAAAGIGSDLERLQTLAAAVRSAQDDLDFAMISGREIATRRDRLKLAIADYGAAARLLASRVAAQIPAGELKQALQDLSQVPDPRAADPWRRQIPGKLARAAQALQQFHDAFDQRLYETDWQVREACDQVARLSRFALAEEAIVHPGVGLVDRVGHLMPLSGYALAENLSPLTLPREGASPATLNVKPTGRVSDLTGGLPAASAAGRTRAVVLLSDGRQVGGSARTVTGLSPQGVPIFTVNLAAAAPPRDIAFAKVSVPARAFIGDTVPIRAELRHDGFDGGVVEVSLKAGDLAEQKRSVELRAGQPAMVDFALELKNEEAGVLPLELSAPSAPGEASEANNHVTRWMKVMPERMRVAVWSGSPGRDYQELCSILSRRPELALSSGIFDGSRKRLSITPEEILRQDVIVLCDLPVTSLSARQWDAVLRLVQDRGGSVILVAGDAHLPGEYGSVIAASTLLPFSASLSPRFRTWPGEQPAFRFIPDPEAASIDLLKLSNDPALAPRRWQELPPVYRFLQLPEMREGKLRPGSRALLVETESRAPVLLERRLGTGRAFFFCINETWRWRFNVGERDQGRFWRQLIHYAAQEPYFANNGSVWLDVDQAAVTPGAAARVRARILDADQRAGDLTLAIFKDGRAAGTRSLAPAGDAGSGRYEGTLSLPEGAYELRLTAGNESAAVPLRVVATDEAEMADLSGDEGLLRQIADSSGGAFFKIDQLGRLADRLSEVSDSRSMYVDQQLWDSPYLFLFVVGCFAAEWALRKQCGLV